MREILFKGKRNPNYGTGWVYGVPYTDHENDCIIATCNSKLVVILETVGQYTGHTDISDKKIFEGDILKLINTKHNILYIVAWCEKRAMFVLSCVTKPELETDFSVFDGKDFKVVGNIYDNPEFIGGK